MTELAELERRIIAALARVDAGIDRLQDSARAAGAAAQDSAGSPDLTLPHMTAPDLADPDPTDPAIAASAVQACDAASASAGISDDPFDETSDETADDTSAKAPAPQEGSAGAPESDMSELAELRAALAAERAHSAALVDRIRTLKGRDQRQQTAAQARIDQLTKQLDVQGLELNRLRKSMIQLREALRVLREGAEGGTVDAAMINKAMMAEMEALRAARSSESAELDSIIAELATLVGEESSNA